MQRWRQLNRRSHWYGGDVLEYSSAVELGWCSLCWWIISWEVVSQERKDLPAHGDRTDQCGQGVWWASQLWPAWPRLHHWAASAKLPLDLAFLFVTFVKTLFPIATGFYNVNALGCASQCCIVHMALPSLSPEAHLLSKRAFKNS